LKKLELENIMHINNYKSIPNKLKNNSTVKSAYNEPAYKELLLIRNWFSFPNFSKELGQYTFTRNSGYKEHICMVPISSL